MNAVIADNNALIPNAAVANKNAPASNVVTKVDAVPAVINYVTSPYNNLMSAARHESAGWSVEPSNVNGIDKHHERWIQLVMEDDWGIQFLHEF